MIKQTVSYLSLGIALLTTSPVFAQASNNIRDKVQIIAMNNPAQQFELAAKLQWHEGGKRWNRVLVTYNGYSAPPNNHPVWSYLSNMRIPQRAGKQPGENLLYKAFYLDAYCNGITPLASGRPMTINFDRNALGQYGKRAFFADWNCPGWNTGMRNVSIVGGREAHSGKGLKLNLVRGQSGCAERGGDNCVNWKPHIGARLDSMTYTYWLMLPSNFDFANGGRLPGVGSVVPLPEGTRANGQNGWSVSTQWTKNGQLGQYIYHADQAQNTGDFFAWNAPALQKGQWHQVKTAIRVNTPKQKNGMVTTWLNGKKVFEKGNLRFRDTNKLLIERLLFAVYYQRSPTANNTVYIDDVRLEAGLR